MALVEWNDSLSVGINKIDIQHQTLVRMLNELHGAMITGKGKEVLEEILDKLINYTAFHFRTEEELFEQYNYDGTEDHKREHSAFVDKVLAFKEDFIADKSLVTIELLNFLLDWIKDHINGSDRKYIDCFKEHGVV